MKARTEGASEDGRLAFAERKRVTNNRYRLRAGVLQEDVRMSLVYRIMLRVLLTIEVTQAETLYTVSMQKAFFQGSLVLRFRRAET